MECDAFFAVVNVKVICDNVFTKNKTIAKALYRYVAKNVIVVLISRRDQPGGVAGIGLEFLAEYGIAHLIIQAKLAVGNVDTGYVLQVNRRLGGVHFPFI